MTDPCSPFPLSSFFFILFFGKGEGEEEGMIANGIFIDHDSLSVAFVSCELYTLMFVWQPLICSF